MVILKHLLSYQEYLIWSRLSKFLQNLLFLQSKIGWLAKLQGNLPQTELWPNLHYFAAPQLLSQPPRTTTQQDWRVDIGTILIHSIPHKTPAYVVDEFLTNIQSMKHTIMPMTVELSARLRVVHDGSHDGSGWGSRP